MVEPRSLAALEAELLAGPTATEALRRWCAARCDGSGRVSAHLVGAREVAPPAEVASRLACRPGEAILHRRVELRWGRDPLSVADNWYLPGRLTPEMNAQLQTGDTPFGEAVAALGVVRHTSRSRRAPSETGLHARRSGGLRAVLRQDAMLVLAASGLPLAAVSETYLLSLQEIGSSPA